MKLLLFATLCITCFTANAQYYYKDIVGTKETNSTIKAYKANKVSRVVLNSYDGDNTRIDDLHAEQQFNPSAQVLKTITRSGSEENSVLTAYIGPNDNVIKTTDSSKANVFTTQYIYDAEGRLQQVQISSNDTTSPGASNEVHLWEYNQNIPSRMLRVKGGIDTTFVTFVTDANGNVIEEKSMRKGVNGQSVYYYYDNKNRLTDIVRYHEKAKRLLPEYMFEYSAQDKVIQKISVPSNNANYLIWRYQYNPGGLIVKEAIYNKQKQLTGKIEYQYSFGL